jgi:hypothetical protein
VPLRFLIRALPNPGEEESFLKVVREIAKNIGGTARNAKWTSKGALEIDLFFMNRSDFRLFEAALEPLAAIQFSKDLNVASPYKPKEELVAEAIQLFNQERYWEAHEVLETVWRNSEYEEKSLLQGIILVCAAFVHHQKREENVAMGVLKRAQHQLHWTPESYLGINIVDLERKSEEILRTNRFHEFMI